MFDIRVGRLMQLLEAAGIPLESVFGSGPGTVKVQYRPSATDAHKAQAQTIIDAFDWSTAEALLLRQQAKEIYDSGTNKKAMAKVLRALALVIMDEINILRAAVVPPLSARTAGQIKTAIENKLDGGTAD